MTLTDIQLLLLRQLSEKPLTGGERLPEFCLDLEAEGLVEMSLGRRDLLMKITARGKRALADADAASPRTPCSNR